MTSDPRELMLEAAALPDGSEQKTALIDEAVRAYDAANEVDKAYDARIKLLSAAVRSGDIDKMLVAFTWCLAKYREKPQGQGRDGSTILWYYKWAALEAPRFPQITRARVHAILDDLEDTYRSHGASMRAVYQHRHYAAAHLGDLDVAKDMFEKWWAAPRDWHADCPACEHSARVDWALKQNDDESAVAIAEELYRKRIKCAEVPHTVYGDTLMPLIRLGRLEEAVQAHRTGLRMLAKLEHNLAGPICEHLSFLSVTGNLRAAQTLVVRWLSRGVAHKNPLTRAVLFANIALLCDMLRLRAGRARSWKMVPIAPLLVDTDARGNVDVDELGEKAMQEALAISAKYDERNGNTYRSMRLREVRDRARWAVELPLRKKRE